MKHSRQELEEIALPIYMRKIRSAEYVDENCNTRCAFDLKVIALSAFREASAYLDHMAAVMSGEESTKPEKPEFVTVPVMEARDGYGGAETFVPVYDENGKAKTELVPVDRCAFAPNLPDSHPINQRFKPADGIPPSKRRRK